MAKPNFTRRRRISLKKAKSNFDLAFFLCYHYKIDPYKTIVQKQSVIFAVRVHLSLGEDGSYT